MSSDPATRKHTHINSFSIPSLLKALRVLDGCIITREMFRYEDGSTMVHEFNLCHDMVKTLEGIFNKQEHRERFAQTVESAVQIAQSSKHGTEDRSIWAEYREVHRLWTSLVERPFAASI